MELLAGISCLLQIVNLVFDVKTKFRKDERSDEISVLLKNIGDTINTVAIELEKNLYPHQKCAEMEYYMRNLESAIKDKITDKEFTELQSKINQAVQVERLLGEMQGLSTEQRRYNLSKLYSISGTFIAAGELIKT